MQSRSIRRSGKPICAKALRARAFGRDLIRGRHYGQRPCVPHQKAEHMAAPTEGQNMKKTLANGEPSTHGAKRQFARRKAMSGVGGKADLPIERPDVSV